MCSCFQHTRDLVQQSKLFNHVLLQSAPTIATSIYL
jgi:hypothetical protein